MLTSADFNNRMTNLTKKSHKESLLERQTCSTLHMFAPSAAETPLFTVSSGPPSIDFIRTIAIELTLI